jgi:hypothetical protein
VRKVEDVLGAGGALDDHEVQQARPGHCADDGEPPPTHEQRRACGAAAPARPVAAALWGSVVLQTQVYGAVSWFATQQRS